MTPGGDGGRAVTRAVRASAGDVWAALTEPAILGRWLGEVSPPFAVGELSQLQTADGDRYALEVFRMEPPRRLEYGWRRFGIDVKETVHWEVVATAGGCVVTVWYSTRGGDSDGRSADHEEWLLRSARLEKCLASAVLPPHPPDREFVLSTDLPGDPRSVADQVLDYVTTAFDVRADGAAGERPGRIALRDDAEPGEVGVRVTSAESVVLLEVAHPTWPAPTSAAICLQARERGTRLSVRHWGWEGTAFDDQARLAQRRRFASFWHRFLLRFTLEYTRSWRVPVLSAADLQTRMERPDVFVFDANRVTLWELGHIPRAVFVGQEDIPLDRLPDDPNAELVFYCRDTMCLTAYLSAAQARTLGYPNTFVMRGGRQAWADSGFPLIRDDGADGPSAAQTDAEGA